MKVTIDKNWRCGRVRNDSAELPPNAVWLGTELTYAANDDQTIKDFVQRLREHEVGTVYAWVSWLQADQTWRGTDNFDAVQTFVRQFKQYYPEAQLYGWVSFPVNVGENNYRLDNVGLQQIIADFSARVTNEFGFDGVFLNVEPVWNDDGNFLALLRKVRAAVGDDVLISAAIPPTNAPIQYAGQIHRGSGFVFGCRPTHHNTNPVATNTTTYNAAVKRMASAPRSSTAGWYALLWQRLSR